MKAKYVKLDHGEIVIFPEMLQHKDFREVHHDAGFLHEDLHPVSAGFIEFFVNDGQMDCDCFGESISLGIHSDPEDTELARVQFLRRI